MIPSKINSFISFIEKKYYSRHQSIYDHDFSFSQAVLVYPEFNRLYAYMNHYFNYKCPQIIRNHRMYFEKDFRGFGEDAFHAAWWLLFSEFKPRYMLEIGVYRGQVISLWALIGRQIGYKVSIHGISPFSPLADSVSTYLQDFDYKSDILNTFSYWKLDSPTLIQALSSDPKAVSHIKNNIWDIIYIDGSHDFNVVLADYKLCYKHLKIGGILVIDDASLDIDFKPPRFSFSGHPGPSRVAREYADKEMKFLGAVGHINIYQKNL